MKRFDASKTFWKSSRVKMLFKIGVLKNFAMFTGKHLSWSDFIIESCRRSDTGVFK